MPHVDLASTGDRLAALAEQQSSRMTARARRLADRQRARRFHVVVVGDFNRGKSTVINALVGTTIVPTDVLPVTSVATEVMFGASGATAGGRTRGRPSVSLGAVAFGATVAGYALGPARHIRQPGAGSGALTMALLLARNVLVDNLSPPHWPAQTLVVAGLVAFGGRRFLGRDLR